MNLWVFWAAAGLSGLLRSCRKRAGPCTAVAPKVALPRKGRQPFRPLRGSLVNPCRRILAVYRVETAHVLSLLGSALFLLHQIVAVAN
jgi:hypothetical protein